VDPDLKKLRQEIASALAGMSSDELSWHPDGKWSTAEILEHLYLTYTGTLKGLSRSTAAGQPVVAKTTWKNRMQCLVVLGFGHLPAGREAPKFSRPKGLPRERVVAEIESQIAEMDRVLSEYAAKFGPRTKLLDHVFLGPFSVNQWRKFHLVHGRHHIRQIHKLRAEMRSMTARQAA